MTRLTIKQAAKIVDEELDAFRLHLMGLDEDEFTFGLIRGLRLSGVIDEPFEFDLILQFGCHHPLIVDYVAANQPT